MKRHHFCAIAAAAALIAGGASAQQTAPRAPDASTRSVAMMDDMDKEMGNMKDMGKMKKMEKEKKQGRGDAGMRGGMPMGPGAGMGNADAAPAMKDGMGESSGMEMMGRMRGSMEKRGMGNMSGDSSLPGFPGASHLYHVGATGFFLDHPEHVTLSKEQEAALNRTREKSALEQATFDRRIEEAEQELWTLTAADSPELARIDAKVRAIEKLRADQRLAFIKAVGEAGKVLTQDQQKAVLGTSPAAAAGKGSGGAAPATAAPSAPAKATPMKLH